MQTLPAIWTSSCPTQNSTIRLVWHGAGPSSKQPTVFEMLRTPWPTHSTAGWAASSSSAAVRLRNAGDRRSPRASHRLPPA